MEIIMYYKKMFLLKQETKRKIPEKFPKTIRKKRNYISDASVAAKVKKCIIKLPLLQVTISTPEEADAPENKNDDQNLTGGGSLSSPYLSRVPEP